MTQLKLPESTARGRMTGAAHPPGGSAGLAPATPVAVVAALTTWLTMFAWSGFTEEPSRFLLPTLVVGVVIVAVGTLCRQLRVSGALTFLLQVLATMVVVFVAISGSLLPDRTAFEALFTAFDGAIESAQSYRSPIPIEVPGVHPLLILGGAITLLLVDLFACTWRRVSFAGLPLVAAFLLPTAMNRTPVSTWVFLVSALWYLLLLYLTEFQLIGRWGRHLDRLVATPTGGDGLASAGLGRAGVAHQRRLALGIGVPAVVLAILVAVATPSWDLSGWGPGSGSRGGGDEITIENPMTDLRRDLTRGEDVAAVSVRTSDPRPDYLRVAVLNRFGSNAWTSGDRDFPDDQSARGQDLPLTGVGPTLARREYDYTISTASGFDSKWLPTPSPVIRVRADGAWKYDRTTIDFLAADEDDELDAADLTYTATALDLQYDARDLAAAPSGAGSVPSLFTKLPDNLPDLVLDLTAEVTESAPSQFEKAVALQNWFRDTGGFEYSLETAPGNGSDELVAFLTEGNGGRVGYCEQFASAMAVMARTLDIPARVAIGFLRPENVSPNVWEYSTWDIHAWPELYFPGSGWVRFEPTPGTRAETIPAYTRQELPAPDEEPSSTTGPSASASGGAGSAREPNLPDESTFQSTSQGSSWPLIVGIAAVAVVLLVGLLLIPRGIRSWRRRQRWACRPQAHWPEVAWTELHDMVLDLGRRWPSGLSPRETRNRLVDWFGAPAAPKRGGAALRPQRGASINPDATAALDRIVFALEETRYSAMPVATDSVGLRTDVETCSSAFRSGATPVARRRATWWPVSALRRQRSVRSSIASLNSNEEVLDQVR